MKRLTKKYDQKLIQNGFGMTIGYFSMYGYDFDVVPENRQSLTSEVINKLGKLEDFEEILNFDLHKLLSLPGQIVYIINTSTERIEPVVVHCVMIKENSYSVLVNYEGFTMSLDTSLYNKLWFTDPAKAYSMVGDTRW